MSLNEFKALILDDLLPTFCNHPKRLYGTEGFRNNFHEIGHVDATNFIRAMNAGLVVLDNKLYKAPRTKAGEQLFWEFDKYITPRETALSVEVVTTIATLSVLHYDFGWPKDCLGTQSLDPHPGAIDVMTYIDDQYPNGYIACEIKKDINKTKKLISEIQDLGTALPVQGLKGQREVTNKKVAALRYWRIPIFWALGPEGYGSVFKMSYSDDGRMAFQEVGLETLRYPKASAIHTDNRN